jgi:excisionase family DNA binding protein
MSKRVRSKQPSSTPPLAVPPQEAARLLSNGISRIYKLMRCGELESYEDGRARRIPMTAIRDYIARRRAATRANGRWRQINARPPRRPKAAAPPKRRAKTHVNQLPAG